MINVEKVENYLLCSSCRISADIMGKPLTKNIITVGMNGLVTATICLCNDCLDKLKKEVE